MQYSFGYGKRSVDINVDPTSVIASLTPNEVRVDQTGADEVLRSLRQPIDSAPLRDIVRPGEKIAIITSDITRPLPSDKILPAVLDELSAAGIADEDILIVFGLGSHKGHSEDQMRSLVGDDVFERIRCVDSDPDNCIRMGVTQAGTPVDVFRPVAQAERRICLGNIEFHYFAGYSGGAKAIMPGVSTRDAIQNNHSAMVRPEAAAGRLDGNPVREDIEEAGRICGIDFIINVVLDEKKEIIRSFCGHPVAAHRAGCAFLDSFYKICLPRRADIVIVSPGGFPKDINMYQAQKALDNARHAVRDGGIVIWIAACSEGLGEKHFEDWMTGHAKSPDMIEHIRHEFVLGGHKAASIALVLEKSRIFLVSDLESDFVRSIFLEPFSRAQDAVNSAFHELGSNSSVIMMPYGGSTLPECPA
ncbi:MAG: nickel-dependent lactate racemase [Clostridiales bacterium]|nr:nickel-dependent lactate racemase [Clostridiales bacterium]